MQRQQVNKSFRLRADPSALGRDSWLFKHFFPILRDPFDFDALGTNNELDERNWLFGLA